MSEPGLTFVASDTFSRLAYFWDEVDPMKGHADVRIYCDNSMFSASCRPSPTTRLHKLT